MGPSPDTKIEYGYLDYENEQFYKESDYEKFMKSVHSGWWLEDHFSSDWTQCLIVASKGGNVGMPAAARMCRRLTGVK